MVPQQRDKIAPLDNHQFAVFDCHRVRGPLPAVEKSNFPEYFSGNDQVEYGVLSLFGRRANSNRAGADDKKSRPGLAFAKNHRTLFDFARDGVGRKLVNNRIVEILEKRMRPQQRVPIERL